MLGEKVDRRVRAFMSAVGVWETRKLTLCRAFKWGGFFTRYYRFRLPSRDSRYVSQHTKSMEHRFLSAIVRTLVFLVLFPCLVSAEWSPKRAPLMTRWAAKVGPTNVLPEYPRPQLVRKDWLNLNGVWDYAITGTNQSTIPQFSGKILVPFPVESALSGVMQPLGDQSWLWYRRTFMVPAEWRGRRVRLHFEAVDWECTVWINGCKVGTHRGGYDSFTFDITDALQRSGTEEIIVRVADPTDGDQPRGKQTRKPENIFYTPSSGIWQTVWLEPVPNFCVERLWMVPDLKARGLKIRVDVASLVDGLEVELVASEGVREAGRVAGPANSTLFLPITNAHLWSPRDPFLYHLQVVLKKDGREVDRVSSYFGMREVSLKRDSAGTVRIALNGETFFHIGTLDQGFWPEGIYTAPTDDALRFDLEFLKSAGFNLVRKHVKVEPQRWYYWCDKLGLLVYQDMPSANNSSAASREQFKMELRRLVGQLFNHPSVIMWVLFNEGWGQFDTVQLVNELHELDPTRLIDNASGWTDMRVGHVVDVHSYPEPASLEPDPERALVLGEFGGIGHRVEGHSWSDKSWSYKDEKELVGLEAWYLHLSEQLRRLRRAVGLCAAVYTQVTDIETECNGLITYDREVVKIRPEVLRAANQKHQEESTVEVVVPHAVSGPIQWRYLLETPRDGWEEESFDDSDWKIGLAGFGKPGTMGAIVRTLWNTKDIWLRRTFILGPDQLQGLKIEMHHDEDAEVYLNGVLATRQTGYLVDYSMVDIYEPALRVLRVGTNTIAVHCRQTVGGQYIDVGLVRLIPSKTNLMAR